MIDRCRDDSVAWGSSTGPVGASGDIEWVFSRIGFQRQTEDMKNSMEILMNIFEE